MREVWIRKRPDGITELSPQLAPLAREDRWLIGFTVIMAAGGIFMAGAMPAMVLGAVVACVVVGEVVLGVKALVLALVRPRAEVIEVPTRQLRRRAQ